jgi:hypothetical protein
MAFVSAAQGSNNASHTSDSVVHTWVVGDIIYLFITWTGGSNDISSISDSLGHVWNDSGILASSGGGDFMKVYWTVATAAGSNTITINYSPAVTFSRVASMMYNDVVNALDHGQADSTPNAAGITSTTWNPRMSPTTLVGGASANQSETWTCTGGTTRISALGTDSGFGDKAYSGGVGGNASMTWTGTQLAAIWTINFSFWNAPITDNAITTMSRKRMPLARMTHA